MDENKRKISTTTDGKPPAPGLENDGAPQPLNPLTGQYGAYWVLNEEERKKGFVRPVRQTYIHAGLQAPKTLRDLTQEEATRYKQFGYEKFEEYDESRLPVTGKFWTKAELEKVGKGCGVSTTMGLAIAETYARNPLYYGTTFCAGCRKHLPVQEFKWEDGSIVGS